MPHTTPQDVKAAAKDIATSWVDSGKAAFESAEVEAKNIAVSARETLTHQAQLRAESGKTLLANETERFAENLRRSDPSTVQGRLMNTFADGIAGVSEDLRGRDVAEIWGDVQALARKHPGAFVAGAGLLGFAAARFLMASANADTHGPKSHKGARG